MAPFTPPPPDPSNTTTTTTPTVTATSITTNSTTTATTATTTRPLFQNPRPPPPQPTNPPHPFYSLNPHPQSQPRLPSNPNPNYPQLAPRHPHPHPHQEPPSHLLYPLSSSGRGYLSRPVPMPPSAVSRPSTTRMPLVFPYLDHQTQAQPQPHQGFIRPNNLPPHILLASGLPPNVTAGAAAGGLMPGVVKGVPVPSGHHPKVGPPSASITDNNGHRDLSDKNKDETFAVIRDRKVRLPEDASLYALCRSWLKNGFPEEMQPQYLDTVKSLPRPLPIAAQVADSPDKKAEDKEEEDEDKESLEQMSEKELLQRHIKRAKRVRSRLREERLQRITRYKTRLALLLPPMVEQHFKNESAAAN